MTRAPAPATAARRLSVRALVPVVLAGVAGFALGFLVDVVSPNPVYGFQLVADVVAVGLVVIAALLPGRRLLPASIGLAIGVIAGVAVGLNVIPAAAEAKPAAFTVRLDTPQIDLPPGIGTCVANGDRLVFLDTKDSILSIPGDRRVQFIVADASYRPTGAVPPASGVGMVAIISTTIPDGPAIATVMGSDPTSTVEVIGTASAGGLAFSGLVLAEGSEGRDPIAIAGTIQWSCPGR